MKYINIHDLSKKLAGRSINSIYNDIEEGRLPKPIKMGNRNIWAESAVDAAMAKLAKEQGAELPKDAE